MGIGMPAARFEILLEDIRNALQTQAENTDGISSSITQVAEELEELNKTMKSVNAYLAQLVSKK